MSKLWRRKSHGHAFFKPALFPGLDKQQKDNRKIIFSKEHKRPGETIKYFISVESFEKSAEYNE